MYRLKKATIFYENIPANYNTVTYIITVAKVRIACLCLPCHNVDSVENILVRYKIYIIGGIDTKKDLVIVADILWNLCSKFSDPVSVDPNTDKYSITK